MERWINLKLLEDKAIFNSTSAVYLKLLSWFSVEHGITALTAGRIEELCEQCGISKSSFRRALKELQKAGIITYHGGSVRIPQCDELQQQEEIPLITKR